MDTGAEILAELLADVERRHADIGRTLAAIRNAVRTGALSPARNTDEDFTASWLLKLYGMRKEAD